ncbi:MAG: GxxExxY protein [Flavobacteriales bacterium]
MEEHDHETYAIIGAAMEVHRQLGSGFLESVYQEALTEELKLGAVPFESEVRLPVLYKGKPLSTIFRADLICFGKIVVELKAIKALTNIDEAQLLNYLKATGMERGLLLNFGSETLQVKRMVRSKRHHDR